jgi:hypothetical protein
VSTQKEKLCQDVSALVEHSLKETYRLGIQHTLIEPNPHHLPCWSRSRIVYLDWAGAASFTLIEPNLQHLPCLSRSHIVYLD